MADARRKGAKNNTGTTENLIFMPVIRLVTVWNMRDVSVYLIGLIEIGK